MPAGFFDSRAVIAVQNFNENLSVLVMLAACAGLLALGADVRTLMAALGFLVAAAWPEVEWRFG